MNTQNPVHEKEESGNKSRTGEQSGNRSRPKTDTDDFDLGKLLASRSDVRSDDRPAGRSSGRFVVVFLLFGTLVGITLLLLLTALVVWLSEVTGSFIVATLLLAGLFALLATGIYLLSIREAVERIRARAETVYEVARLARSGYEWISGKITLVTGIYRMMHRE